MTCRPLLIISVCFAIGAVRAVVLQTGAASQGVPREVDGETGKAQQDFTEVSSLFCQEVNGIVKSVATMDKEFVYKDLINFDKVQDVLAYNNVTVGEVHTPADMVCKQTSNGTLDLKFGYKADHQTFHVNPLCGRPNAEGVRKSLQYSPLAEHFAPWWAILMTVQAQSDTCDGTIIMGITSEKVGENLQDFIGNCEGLGGENLTGTSHHEPSLYHEFKFNKYRTTGIYLFGEVAPGRYSANELVYGINGTTMSLRKNDRLEVLKFTGNSHDTLSYELRACNSSTSRMAPVGALSPFLDLPDKRPSAREMYNYVELLQKLGNDGVW